MSSRATGAPRGGSNNGGHDTTDSGGSTRPLAHLITAPLPHLRPHPHHNALATSSAGNTTTTAVASTTTTTTSSFGHNTTSLTAAMAIMTSGHRPTSRPPSPSSYPSKLDMDRTSAVSEEVWAQAIHAVKVQKMSLRQAAQLYGVHHMSLHRRVRGRYATTMPPSSDIRSFLTPDDEAEVVGVLREQFIHEKRITSDDIRFVVRAIASQGGKQSIPPEFPPSRWIMDFKRSHGFAKLNSYAYPPSSGSMEGGSQMMEDFDDTGSNYSGYSMGSSVLSAMYHREVADGRADRAERGERSGGNEQASGRNNSNNVTRDNNSTNGFDADREDFGSSANGSVYDTGLTTGSSSGGSYENGESEKRTYRLSHSVPPETWEKAIAAVEQQGMSLRAAAKMYGVHFAALHRRVKKRAQGKQASGVEGYFQSDDEAGIIRVVVARAELGVLMNFDELMDLVQRAALRNLPDLSVEAARKLMTRFQTRNEHSIRHIISDWPLPRANPLNAIPRVVNMPQDHQAAIGSARPSMSMTNQQQPLMAGTRVVMPPQQQQTHAHTHTHPPPAPPSSTMRVHMVPSSSASSSSSARSAPLHHGEMKHRTALPSLRSDFGSPPPPFQPPPTASIMARHPLHPPSGNPQQRRLMPQPPTSAAAASVSSSLVAAAAGRGHGHEQPARYLGHDDRERRERDHRRYESSSYNNNGQHGNAHEPSDRRASGEGISEGDTVMFV